MKKFIFSLQMLFFFLVANSQLKPFQFAFISDTHIGSPDGIAEQDNMIVCI